MKELKDIKAEAGTIKARILEDADGEVSYIKDAAERGCIGGNCSDLVYYKDTHEFYMKHADEIDEMIMETEEEMGEPYNIGENMKRLGQLDLRNFMAWFAYEIEAQEIMRELEEEHIHEWGEPKEGDNGEKIRWCKTCEATKDSNGGIIE